MNNSEPNNRKFVTGRTVYDFLDSLFEKYGLLMFVILILLLAILVFVAHTNTNSGEYVSLLGVELYKKPTAIPRGAVVPFVAAECPENWEEYNMAAGMTIIGVGKGQRDSPYLLLLTWRSSQRPCLRDFAAPAVSRMNTSVSF